MVKYLLYLIPNFTFMLICFILNPFVILFTKEDGNLPYCLRYFQTHDHSLFFDDDWISSHWSFLINIKPDWLKLYLCRLFWLYRNTGYDFAYEVLGINLDSDWKVLKNTDTFYFSYENTKSWINCGWCLKINYHWSSVFMLDVYLGWKQKTMNINGRTMIAMRISPFKGG